MLKRILIRFNTLWMRSVGMQIGKRSAVYPGSEISRPSAVQIGNDSVIYKCVSILSHDQGNFIMGDNSHIAPYSYLLLGSNKLKFGNDVAIGPFTAIFCRSNKMSKGLHRSNYHNKDISLGNNIFIGAHSLIMPGTIIEDNVVVAANSTVMGHLKEGGVYAGNPAQRIREINAAN